jgi:hypothetical protein
MPRSSSHQAVSQRVYAPAEGFDRLAGLGSAKATSDQIMLMSQGTSREWGGRLRGHMGFAR